MKVWMTFYPMLHEENKNFSLWSDSPFPWQPDKGRENNFLKHVSVLRSHSYYLLHLMYIRIISPNQTISCSK